MGQCCFMKRRREWQKEEVDYENEKENDMFGRTDYGNDGLLNHLLSANVII